MKRIWIQYIDKTCYIDTLPTDRKYNFMKTLGKVVAENALKVLEEASTSQAELGLT